MISKLAPLALFVTASLGAVFGARGGDTSLVAIQDKPAGQGNEMAEMMAKAKKFTSPGKHHKELERLLGTWTTETRFFQGPNAMPPEKGEAEFRWRMQDRWVEGTWKGTMMRMPVEGVLLFGYDNFKQSFVYSQVTTMDTAMLHAEGDMDPSGKAMLLYGTLDEYLTGEHDKMVKYVWRFASPDEMSLEVHDLPIGENHAKVVEVTYKRKK